MANIGNGVTLLMSDMHCSQNNAPFLFEKLQNGHFNRVVPGGGAMASTPGTVSAAIGGDLTLGTRNGCLHVGHCTCLPGALSGSCIALPQAAFGHVMIIGMNRTQQRSATHSDS